MRQKDDALFASALNSLRIRQKNETMRHEIDDMLKTRVDQPDEPVTALNIFGTHAKCDKHNDRLVNRKCDALFDLSATDLRKDASGKLRSCQSIRKVTLQLCLVY